MYRQFLGPNRDGKHVYYITPPTFPACEKCRVDQSRCEGMAANLCLGKQKLLKILILITNFDGFLFAFRFIH